MFRHFISINCCSITNKFFHPTLIEMCKEHRLTITVEKISTFIVKVNPTILHFNKTQQDVITKDFIINMLHISNAYKVHFGDFLDLISLHIHNNSGINTEHLKDRVNSKQAYESWEPSQYKDVLPV